jgi:hypothetical protein
MALQKSIRNHRNRSVSNHWSIICITRLFFWMAGTMEEMSSKTFLDVTHPAHRDTDRANVEKMWRGEIPAYRTEKRYIAKWRHSLGKLVRIPHEEPDTLHALNEFRAFIENQRTSFHELVQERTSDEEMQEKTFAALMALVSH